MNARILQVFELDEYTNELKLRDGSGEVFYTLALKLKFPHLRQGAVVRIRSATVDETSAKKVLVLQHVDMSIHPNRMLNQMPLRRDHIDNNFTGPCKNPRIG